MRGILLLWLVIFPQPVMILIVRFITGMFTSSFEISYSAEIPQIYGKERMLQTNAFIARLSSIGMVIGFLAGGYLYHTAGYEFVLVLDGFTYFISAAVLVKLRWEKAEMMTTRAAHVLKQFAADLYEVKVYLWMRPMLLIIFAMYLVDSFGSGSHNLGIPLLAEQIDPIQQGFYYGLIWSIWAAGNVLATYFLPRWKRLELHLYRVCLYSTMLMSCGFISIFMSDVVPIVLLCAFVTGMFDAVAMTSMATLLQQSDNAIRGRVFGVSSMLNKLGFGLGFIVVPFLIEALSLQKMIYMMHGTIIIGAIIAIYIYNQWLEKSNKREIQYGFNSMEKRE
jgi:MFS family permease